MCNTDSRLRLKAHGLTKYYETGSGPFLALDDVDLEASSGDFIAVTGRSGSGKSTLINLLAGLDQASSGTIISDSDGGMEITALSEEELARWRGRSAGIVFQFFQLLPSMTILENTMLPMDLCNVYPRSERRDRARELLLELAIEDQAGKLPRDLSGGQQQRAAIARALVNDPPLIFADEPTGNLDSQTGTDVIELFARQTQKGKAVIMVTHDLGLAPYFTRTLVLEDGKLVSNLENEQ